MEVGGNEIPTAESISFPENIWSCPKKFLSLQRLIKMKGMAYTEKIIIKNPSRKLEEHLRWIGVQKYLRLRELGSEESQPVKVVLV